MTGALTAKNGITVSGGELVVGAASALRCNKKQIKSGYSPSERTYTLPDKSGTVALTSDLSGLASADTVYTKTESDGKYLPLTGGTLTGNLTFGGGAHLIFGSLPYIQAAYGSSMLHWSLPAVSGTIALDADVQRLSTNKADAEVEPLYRTVAGGIFWEENVTGE